MASPTERTKAAKGTEALTSNEGFIPRDSSKSNLNGRKIKKGNIISDLLDSLGRIACIRSDAYKPIK